jgi:hypothetical protein
MILKLRIGHWRITFTFAQVTDVIGVNSKLPNGNHILMWDFDNTPLNDIRIALTLIQAEYNLPNIYILKTSEPDNYIAYCFDSTPWNLARAIIGCTPLIDENFFKWAVFRRRFTLRVGAKAGVMPHIVAVLRSIIEETATIEELRSWVRYETLDAHHNQSVHRVEFP